MHALCAVVPFAPERSETHRRPRAQEAVTDEDVEYHLGNWARWHRLSRYSAFRRLWYPGRASGGMGNSGSTTVDDMCEGLDDDHARIMNTLIDDLPTTQRCAVHYIYLEARAVFKFPRSDLATEYANALASLRTGMVRKGIA